MNSSESQRYQLLPITPSLAPTPSSPPRWGVEVKLRTGEKVTFVDPSATRALVALMDMQAVMGGAACHFGGPSAFAELMSALFGLIFDRAQKNNQPWYEWAHIINDAGHCENGLYALKANYGFAHLGLNDLKRFRSIESPLSGHGEAHLFPQGVYLSNGPLGSSIAQAQGLAFADQLIQKNRITVVAISDGACMEGEAREALASIPGFAQKGKLAPFLLVISDNNTKLTGRIDSESFSMQPTFRSLKELGWKVVEFNQAHDLPSCVSQLEILTDEILKNPSQPIALWAKTIKGYGVKSTEQSSSGGHGFPLSDPQSLGSFIDEIYQGKEIPPEFLAWMEEMVTQKHKASELATKETEVKESMHPIDHWLKTIKKEKIQNGVSRALIKMAQKGWPLFSLSSDLPGSTGVREFQKAFPHCAQDVGVAESNMISMAAGLSKAGFIPVVDTFAQFGVTKGSLPLIMASLSEAPLMAFFSHTGFQDAADGASHQSLSWLSMVASIPYTECYALTCSEEAEALVVQAVERFAQMRQHNQVPPSFLFFLGRENFPVHYEHGLSSFKARNFQLGSSQLIYESPGTTRTDDLISGAEGKRKKTITICAGGSSLYQAMKAVPELEKNQIHCLIVQPSNLNHPDLELLEPCLQKSEGRLITIEDHQLVGGMSAIIIHKLVEKGISLHVNTLAVNGHFGRSAYKADELYHLHKIDSRAIVEAALKMK